MVVGIIITNTNLLKMSQYFCLFSMESNAFTEMNDTDELLQCYLLQFDVLGEETIIFNFIRNKLNKLQIPYSLIDPKKVAFHSKPDSDFFKARLAKFNECEQIINTTNNFQQTQAKYVHDELKILLEEFSKNQSNCEQQLKNLLTSTADIAEQKVTRKELDSEIDNLLNAVKMYYESWNMCCVKLMQYYKTLMVKNPQIQHISTDLQIIESKIQCYVKYKIYKIPHCEYLLDSEDNIAPLNKKAEKINTILCKILNIAIKKYMIFYSNAYNEMGQEETVITLLDDIICISREMNFSTLCNSVRTRQSLNPIITSMHAWKKVRSSLCTIESERWDGPG